jgi:transcription elongation factor Elf1
MQERIITFECPHCSKKTCVSIRIFYDGYEGPILCDSCGEELDFDDGE